MIQRSVSESEVESVIQGCDIEYTDHDGNTILVGHPAGRYIKVVIARGTDPPFVITVGD
jgi:hypothetical protein